MIGCLATVQCIPAYQSLKAAGFTGIFNDPLGPIPALAKTMAGSLTLSAYNTNPQGNPGLVQMTKDLNAFKAGTVPSGSTNVPAYLAADMFIQALKKVGRKNLTAQAVQKALASQTWQIKGMAGPTQYPASSVASTPLCVELLTANADGSYTIAEPYTCSYKRYTMSGKPAS